MKLKTIAGCLLIASLGSGAAGAFEMTKAQTRAAWVVPESAAPAYIDLTFGAELNRAERIEGDLVVSWEAVGGIDPTPFLVHVPAACFERSAGSLSVGNHRECGVGVSLLSAEGREIRLPVYAFSATITERRGYARLTLSTAIGTSDGRGDATSRVLGILGGASQSVLIGEQASTLLPNLVDIVGFNPQPEPPAVGF